MLELKSLDAGYGSFQALFGVNLEVKAGEAVGVIGPNGAGKTTLMRVISGLIRPTRGTIAMEGTDVVATPAHRIVGLGIAHVPENRRLFPRLTVEDNLKMGAFMPAGARQVRATAGGRVRSLPAPEGAPQPDGRHHVGRRAADVRHRPRADERSQAAAARRAVGRPGAGRGAAGLRAGPAHPRGRAHRADRRAERAAGAEGRRPRLSAGGRHHPRLRQRSRDAGKRH